MGAGTTGQPLSKAAVGGNPRTMGIGMGIVAGGLALFYYAQYGFHKRDDQTWIVRHGQQPGNEAGAPMPGSRLLSSPQKSEPGPGKPKSLPLPGNTDNRGSEGAQGSLMSFVAGKGTNPDPSVPENPQNMQEPAAQRRNDSGSQYTKAGGYADSYKKRPEDPSAPKEGRA
ncbi:hypothetical protein PHLCEN_2v13527 [Hermanssonia centrifuga]|uniref:Uncharacterized protein n=1 Tax=Hermanssonia centrifuga TaxID=98765 RepID=A0A2R6NE76_9APHY|nr:hypothetical protein PHLCEN_2v13527 [Hermanssonia centrifuga]